MGTLYMIRWFSDVSSSSVSVAYHHLPVPMLFPFSLLYFYLSQSRCIIDANKTVVLLPTVRFSVEHRALREAALLETTVLYVST